MDANIILLFIQELILIFTFITLILEVKALKKSTDFSTYHAITGRIQEIDRYVIEHAEFAKLIATEIPASENEDYIKKVTFIYYMLNFAELLYLLWERKMIDDRLWAPWKQSILGWMAQTDFQEWWLKKINPRKMYYEGFRNFINDNVEFDREIVEAVKEARKQYDF